MKKIFCSLVIVSVAVFVIGGAVAQAATNIGYIDVQKVFKGYNETAKAQEQVSKQEDEFKKDFEASQKQLADAEKSKMKKADLDKMKKDLEDKLMPKRQELVALNEKLTTDLQAKILAATKDVAKEIGIDVIFDKQVVITGGTDLSDLVINKLNEKK